jgi:replicative DNA helicase
MSSFRESSGIEYSADILIGLQYEEMEYFTEKDATKETDAKHQVRVLRVFERMQQLAAEGKSQPIELKLLKNRNGSRGTLAFDFTPKYNFFEPHGEPTTLTEADFKNPNGTQKGKKRNASVNF